MEIKRYERKSRVEEPLIREPGKVKAGSGDAIRRWPWSGGAEVISRQLRMISLKNQAMIVAARGLFIKGKLGWYREGIPLVPIWVDRGVFLFYKKI